MSGGGGTTAEIGGGLLTAGLIASTVMSDGATAPLLGDELATGTAGAGAIDSTAAALGGNGALIGSSGEAPGFFTAAEGAAPGIFSAPVASALPTGIDTLGQYSAENLGEYGGPQIGSDAAAASNNVASAMPTTPSYAMNPITGQPMTADQIAGSGSTATGGNGIVGGGNAPTQTPWYQNYWNQLKDTSGKGMNLAQKATLGGAGIATLLALQKSGAMTPKGITPYNPVTAQSMGLGAQMSPNYMPNRASQWGYAAGGVTGTSATPQNVMPADLQNQQTVSPIQLQALMAQYGVTPQQATQGIQSLMGNQTAPKAEYSEGGETHLKEGSFILPADVVSHFGNGSTDAGLHALSRHLGASPIRGSGDGMSDDIHTTIDGRQPARVADGEAMVSPDRVKALGGGSTDAGAKKLYTMMNKIRKARTGSTKQGKQIKADKYLPT